MKINIQQFTQAQVQRFNTWLMGLTSMMRYLVIAILFHAGVIAILATIKLAVELPRILAELDGSTPAPNDVAMDDTAVLRDFQYDGPTLGEGGGTPGKGPGGIPTAAGTTPTEYKAVILSEHRSEEPVVGELVGVTVDASQAFRTLGAPGGITAPTVGLGPGLSGTAGVRGPGGNVFGARSGPVRSQIMNNTARGREIERAVMAGLRWLKQQQNANGSWNGPSSQPAVSALAVLAFLGHGETPESKEFGNTVLKGLQYLVSQVGNDGIVQGHNMYAQGAVTLALAEAYGMTRSAAIKETMGRAINAIVQSQRQPKKSGNHAGGWRYRPSSTDADTSVSGWLIMALKSAKLAGLEVPEDSFNKASNFLWHMYGQNGFGYNAPAGRPSTTAIGVLCQQFLGHGGDARIKPALDLITTLRPNWQKSAGGWVLYNWYYANQAMFQAGGSYWREWNSSMCEAMLRNQSSDGHWGMPPQSTEARYGSSGYVYTTAMGCLILEVYYRYLPLYRQLERR
jgi:hypothetical protein